MSSENQNDNANNVPTITDESQKNWEASLTQADRDEILRNAHFQRAVAKAAKEERKVDWNNLSEIEFQNEKRKLGLG